MYPAVVTAVLYCIQLVLVLTKDWAIRWIENLKVRS